MTRETYILLGLLILMALLAVGFATRRSSARDPEEIPVLPYAVADEAGVTGGRVTGLVHGRDGRPGRARLIVLQDTRNGDTFDALSGADGRFRFEHVAPGDYLVIVTPEEEDEGPVDEDGQPRDLATLYAQLDMTMATVVEGETVDVELGAPGEQSVREPRGDGDGD